MLLKTIDSKTEGGNEFLVVTIIPGNINSGQPRQKFIFHQNLLFVVSEGKKPRAGVTQAGAPVVLIRFPYHQLAVLLFKGALVDRPPG